THPPPRCSSRFPYTTLFRSTESGRAVLAEKPVNFALCLRHRDAGVFRVGHQPTNSFSSTPIRPARYFPTVMVPTVGPSPQHFSRSEEHTSELQSRENLVCRL